MQHSASSIELADRCDRAWWHRYRDGLKQPEFSWLKAKRMKARGDRMPAGAFSKALGKEMHRLGEIYLYTSPKKVQAQNLIDWHDLPGQCLAEIVPHLPPAGSVRRRDVESRFSIKVAGVRFRGLIDLLGVALERAVQVYDHKTTRDIREYALLPDVVAKRIGEPKRSLLNNLQACLYVLARTQSPHARTDRGVRGGLCRWNYSETQRSRRALPVVQFIPTAHALAVAKRGAETAKRVESHRTIDDATPNITACDQYGGCWYRSEGHCRVRRPLGTLIKHAEQEEKMKAEKKPMRFKDLSGATARANAKEEAKAGKPKKAAPPLEAEEDEEDDTDAEDEEEAPESEPAPKRMAKATKKAAPVEEDEDDTDEEADEEPAPKAKATRKSKPATERERLAAATAEPDHILQFFGAAGHKGDAKIYATAIAELAEHLSNNLPRNPERAFCLRLLLQASDCAVRSASSEA